MSPLSDDVAAKIEQIRRAFEAQREVRTANDAEKRAEMYKSLQEGKYTAAAPEKKDTAETGDNFEQFSQFGNWSDFNNFVNFNNFQSFQDFHNFGQFPNGMY